MDILTYVLAGLVVIIIGRKVFLAKTITHYSPTDAANKIKNSMNVILLDVRTPAERKSSSIKGSLHIPLYELSSRSDELKKYKEKEIICYCRSGNRSLSAAAKLKKSGFNVANMKGGISAWNATGLR